MALTARKVDAAKPGRHSDGEGLTLLVQRSGSRSWVLRVQVSGTRKDYGLGSYPSISLSQAREKARTLRKSIKAGDTTGTKPAKALTFREAAEQLMALKRPGWRNAKHAWQWTSTLSALAYPTLGDRDLRLLTTEDILGVLSPVWTTKPETASRLRQRIEAVFDYASALGVFAGSNPARWRGHLSNLLPPPTKVRAVRHHPALDWREAPAFMAVLAGREGVSPRALAFTILTSARSGEVRGMRWGEVDLEGAIWTVPAARMKAGKEHRQPLTPAAAALLGAEGPHDKLVFPSPADPDAPLSDMTLLAVLRRLGRRDLTVHGFRSTFRDWAGETTGHAREVIEAALAHQLKDKAEAAYARGDLFTKRRRLMDDWAVF